MKTAFLEDIKKTIADNKPVHITYYGPSTTSFEYIFPNWGEILRYVIKDRLEDSMDYYQVQRNIFTHNYGLDGATSAELLARYRELILDTNPYILILHAGINDFELHAPLEESKNTITKLIEEGLSRGIRVVYWTSIPSTREEYNSGYAPYYQAEMEIAAQFTDNPLFVFVDAFTLFPKEEIDASYSLIEEYENPILGLKPGDVDHTHFNRHGNGIVAGILLENVFGIKFDSKRFLKDLLDLTKRYPSY